MRLLPILFLLLLTACTNVPDAGTIYDKLGDGDAHVVVQMNGEAFYRDDSRFRGEVAVAPDRFRLNITDQYDGNVIITLDTQGLFATKPVQRTITMQHQTAGSVMIGRVRDRAKRTGDGFIMTEGTLTIESLSDECVVIRLAGKIGNFNRLSDASTWKRLTGLLVYRKPTITVPDGAKKTLFY